jgi:hypothetical protein
MQGAPTRRIIEVVNKCPTQALTYKNNGDLSEQELENQFVEQKEEENPRTLNTQTTTRVKPTNVRIMKDGPIVVDGDYEVIGANDETLKPSIMTSFCRCGGSGNLPYCDGTHRKIGFSDE